MSTVTLKHVNKVFNKNVVAVKDVNLDIKDKEFLVLVGPSGCGKSTTLRMIAGLEELSSGEIYIDDVLVNEIPPKDRDIAMVFQNYALYPHMKVYDNLAFALRRRKMSKQEIHERVLEASRILSLDELLERKPKELSGGQRQRVALGRALVRDPKVFLFDEPLSNLDAKLRVQMRAEISQLHTRLKYTMVYVTHDQTEAMTMGDRIVVMKDGDVHQVDTPLNLYHHPVNKFVAGFIGSPSMNFIYGQLKEEDTLSFVSDLNPDFKLPVSGFRDLERLQDYRGKPIIMGVRPEDIFDDVELTRSNNLHAIDGGEVRVVEPMGNESFIYVDLGVQEHVLVRSGSKTLPEIGAVLPLNIDLDTVHFFDAQSEANISNKP